MPIRFRCAYCNQLMGISRRKAGTVVRCPSCSGQVVVPNPSSEPTEKPQPAAQPELFERSNFDELFEDAAGGKRSPARPAVAAAPRPTPEQPQALGSSPGVKAVDFAFDVEPVPMAPPDGAQAPMPEVARPGIVLSPRLATLAIVGIIVGLALAFTLGMIVGMMLVAPPKVEGAASQETAGRILS